MQRRRSGTSSLKEAAALAASLAAANARTGDDSGRSTLRYMPSRGNPFAPLGSLGDDDRASLGGDSDESDEVVDEDAAEMDDDDEDAQGPGNRSQRRQDRFGSQWVVTLSALNGFAPAVGECSATTVCVADAVTTLRAPVQVSSSCLSPAGLRFPLWLSRQAAVCNGSAAGSGGRCVCWHRPPVRHVCVCGGPVVRAAGRPGSAARRASG